MSDGERKLYPRVEVEKSRYEHTDVSIRLKLFLPLSFCLKDLVWGPRRVGAPHFVLIFLSLEAFGLLVLLSFDISAFTPAAYQRHRL
jgi:hypothetical protein